MPQDIYRRFLRRSGLRDAKILVIASEGERTEPQYFAEFQKRHPNGKIHVHLLTRESRSSSPKHICQQLVDFKREYKIKMNDELWMVIDIDKWTPQELSEVAKICIQKGFGLAVSNPCFEIWLFLHLSDVENPEGFSSCALVEERLREKLGSYNKNKIDCEAFLPYIGKAISRAERMDTEPESRWPNSIGTRVYKIAQRMI